MRSWIAVAGVMVALGCSDGDEPHDASTGGSSGQSDADSGMQEQPADASTNDFDAGTGLVRDRGWADACGGVTAVGHCVGDVLEWCDYFTSGLQQLDCGAHGMTCQAGLMPNMDDEGSGCVGGPCAEADEGCEGDLFIECRQGTTFASTCRRVGGAGSECEILDDERTGCPSAVACAPEFDEWCDGTTYVTCTADGLRIRDCTSHDPDGECKVFDEGYSQCDPL